MRWYPIPTENGIKRLPSVTTVLDVTMPLNRKASLHQAQATNPLQAAKRTQQARGLGNEFDRWIKLALVKRRLPPLLPYPALRLCVKVRPWLRAVLNGDGPVFVDRLVFTDRYAGTLDAVAPHPRVSGLVLYEVKTSAYKVWPAALEDAQLQAIAYALAWAYGNPEIRLAGVCTVHVTPYQFEEHLVTDVDGLGQLCDRWQLRLQQFSCRYREVADYGLYSG
jgi:hypothetical protein